MTIQFKPNEAVLLVDKVLGESRLLDEFTSKTQVLAMTAKVLSPINPPQIIVEHVTLLARTFNYTIEDINESIGRIILGSSFNWTSWGFFYPVYISIQNDGNINFL